MRKSDGMPPGNDDAASLIRKHTACYHDFPKPGVFFWDVFSLTTQPKVMRVVVDACIDAVKKVSPPIQCICALESRGFIIGPSIALQLELPFVPVRKKGKLPGKVLSVGYTLEYGEEVFEMQEDAFKAGTRVAILDDILATGGSLDAACSLVKRAKGVVAQCIVLIELPALKGRSKIKAPLISIVEC